LDGRQVEKVHVGACSKTRRVSRSRSPSPIEAAYRAAAIEW
jgi:hypothetical protein